MGSVDPDPVTAVLNLTSTITFALTHPGAVDPRYDLELRAFYEPTSGPPLAIGTQRIHLAAVDSQSQPVTLSMDLTSCRSDRPAAATCPVHIVLLLWLVDNGVKLDYQILGPYALSPGGVTTLPGTIAVAEIVNMEVRPQTPALAVGDTVSLDTRFFTLAGDTVVRPVVWGTEHPAIASVDSAGLVTAVSPGQANIMAYWGEGQASFGTTVHVAP